MFIKAVLVIIAAVLLVGNVPAQVTCTGTVIWEPAGGLGLPVMYYHSYFEPANAVRFVGTNLRVGDVVTVYEVYAAPSEIWYRISANTWVQGFALYTREIQLNQGCPFP